MTREMTGEKHTNTTATWNTVPSLEPKPLSTRELRACVARAIASLQSQGIRDWEILEAWSDLAWKAGDRKTTRLLEQAAQDLKEIRRSQQTKTTN